MVELRINLLNILPMKKSELLRNRLWSVVAVAAIAFAVSCSKDATVDPADTQTVLQTRATPVISFACTPLPLGDNETYLGLKETYQFSANAQVQVSDDTFAVLNGDISVLASDGSMNGFELLPDNRPLKPIGVAAQFVKFTEPGYYHLTYKTEHDGAVYQQTKTYCVASNAERVVLPDAIKLGVPFDFSFVFSDPAYPAPTISISETVFDDPRITVLDNDDRGNFRLRIDQPGNYYISTGLGGRFSATVNIALYWRPEETTRTSDGYFNINTGKGYFANTIAFVDSNNILYNVLPHRLYFEYTTDELSLDGNPAAAVSGTKKLAAGSSGVVSMPNTDKMVKSVVLGWNLFMMHPTYLHWDLTIPEDKMTWVRVVDPDDILPPVDPTDPSTPGGTIDPLEPGGTIIG